MAVTITVTRNFSTTDQTTYVEYCTAVLTGTYLTNGFTFNPFQVFASKGSSPIPSTNFLNACWVSPLGYTYYTTVTGNVATTKIFSAANTELANATAVPDASLQLILTKKKI